MGTLIRRKTFETNSSSTHSITFCTEDEFEKFTNGELLFIKEEQKFLKPEEVETFYKRKALKEKFEIDWEKHLILYKDEEIPFSDSKDREEKEDELADKYIEDLDSITEEEMEDVMDGSWTGNPIDYETYCDYINMFEWYDESYTTETGDKIVAFGYYGYN